MDFKKQQPFSGVLILLCAIIPALNSQEVRHTLQNGQSPCPGEEIIFTCVTRGSPVLAWTSDQYIEQGGQLEFATFDNENETRTSPINANTVAVLTRKAMENGEQVLESELHIITLRIFPTFSVSCIHIGTGNMNETTFQLLLDDPSEPQNSTSYQSNDRGSCTVHVSWATPRNTAVVDITRYMVHINDSNILNATSISKNSSYSVNQVHCALHNITIRAVNRCGQLGLSSSVIIPHLVTIPDGREGTTDTNTPTPIPEVCPPWKIAVSVIVPALISSLCWVVILLVFLKIHSQDDQKHGTGSADSKTPNPMHEDQHPEMIEVFAYNTTDEVSKTTY